MTRISPTDLHAAACVHLSRVACHRQKGWCHLRGGGGGGSGRLGHRRIGIGATWPRWPLWRASGPQRQSESESGLERFVLFRRFFHFFFFCFCFFSLLLLFFFCRTGRWAVWVRLPAPGSLHLDEGTATDLGLWSVSLGLRPAAASVTWMASTASSARAACVRSWMPRGATSAISMLSRMSMSGRV